MVKPQPAQTLSSSGKLLAHPFRPRQRTAKDEKELDTGNLSCTSSGILCFFSKLGFAPIQARQAPSKSSYRAIRGKSLSPL
jgi:hypothetical protein